MTQNGASGDPGEGTLNLREVSALIWSSRWYVLAGAVIGVALTMAIFSKRIETTHLTSVPVRVAITSLPAITDPDTVINGVRAGMEDPEIVGAAFDSLLASSPEFAASAKAADYTTIEFVRDVTVRKKEVLRLKSGGGGFILELRLPIMGLGSHAGDAALTALNAFLQKRNQIGQHDIENRLTALRRRIEVINHREAAAFVESLQVSTELVGLQIDLDSQAKAAGIVPLPDPGFSELGKLPLYKEGATPQEVASANRLNIDREVRTTAALIKAGRITDEQAKSYFSRLADIQFRFFRILTDVAIARTTSDQNAFVDYGAVLTYANSPAEFLLPIFEANPGVGRNAASLEVEREEQVPRQRLPIVFGGLVAATLGMLAKFISDYALAARRGSTK